MYLLLKLLSNLVEAERTGALQENQFVVEVVEGAGGEEMVHIGKELFMNDMDPVCLGCEFRTDADEFVNATFQTEVRDLGIELVRGCTGLEHVRENECPVQTTPNPS